MLLIEELINAGQEIVNQGLVRGSGGNLSGKLEDQIYITRSGADLGALSEADFARIQSGGMRPDSLPEEARPSSELAMHLAAYEARPAASVVLHVHPQKCIGLGSLGRSLPALTPDFYLHLGPETPLSSYVTPTTPALARAVAACLAASPAVLLQNHGALVTGSTVKQALLRLLLLEEHAAIYLDALAAGEPRSLTADEMRQLDEVTGYRYKPGRSAAED